MELDGNGHREIPVKVTAWVDEGIAALVVALNAFDEVMTLDSCQRGGDGCAYVLFCHRGTPGAAASFACRLAGALDAHGGGVAYVLAAEWRPGTDEPLLRLTCPESEADGLAAVLSASVELSS